MEKDDSEWKSELAKLTKGYKAEYKLAYSEFAPSLSKDNKESFKEQNG